MDISLIIPAYNEESIIGDTLAVAIKNSRSKFREIIVVDNASTDRTAEVARKYPEVTVIYEARKGLTSARQAGLEAAKGEFLAYLDADTQIPEHWIDTAEKIFAEQPNIVSLSGPRRYFSAAWYRLWTLNMLWTIAPIAYPFVGYMILGANFIARKSAIEAVGGFDRSIEFYGEDTDLARRLSKVGKVLFRMDFFVRSSARRFEAEGILKANFIYMLNFFWPVLFGRPFTKVSRDVR